MASPWKMHREISKVHISLIVAPIEVLLFYGVWHFKGFMAV